MRILVPFVLAVLLSVPAGAKGHTAWKSIPADQDHVDGRGWHRGERKHRRLKRRKRKIVRHERQVEVHPFRKRPGAHHAHHNHKGNQIYREKSPVAWSIRVPAPELATSKYYRRRVWQHKRKHRVRRRRYAEYHRRRAANIGTGYNRRRARERRERFRTDWR